jgi:hypothetical protein
VKERWSRSKHHVHPPMFPVGRIAIAPPHRLLIRTPRAPFGQALGVPLRVEPDETVTPNLNSEGNRGHSQDGGERRGVME